MANTLTNLIPDLYEALDIVSRELCGFIPACTLDANAARAAVGQSVIIPVSPAHEAEDTTPGVTPPTTGDQTWEDTSITITKSKTVPFRYTGEEQKGLNSGPGYVPLRVQNIAQAMRTLCNMVEADLAANYIAASRAIGAAGTTPFTTNLSEAALALQVLQDNGAPMTDLQMVIDTTAGVKMRSIGQLTKANEAGNDTLLRQGVLLDLYGFAVRESAQTKYHTKGTGASYVTNLTGTLAAGATDIAVDTGTGTVLAGDIATFAGDTNKYVVGTALSGGSLSIAKPGLRASLADGVAMTVGNSYRANMAFSRSAMILAARAPALPEEGDMALDRIIVTDPRSGLSFEVAMYPLYRMVRYEVSLAWGSALIKPEHSCIILG